MRSFFIKLFHNLCTLLPQWRAEKRMGYKIPLIMDAGLSALSASQNTDAVTLLGPLMKPYPCFNHQKEHFGGERIKLLLLRETFFLLLLYFFFLENFCF